jgi:hypothetical protein
MTHRLRVAVLTALLTLSIVVFGVYSNLGPTTSRAHAAGQAQPFTHQKSNVVQAILDSGDGQINLGEFKNPPSPICTAPTSSAANVNTDCELTAPHNETTLAVNPTNPLNIIASANDYQLITSSGGTLKETIFSRAHVTFDGGQTWTTYPINYKNYIATGDPAVTFDANGTAYLSTLGFLFSQGPFCCTNPDILVAHSTDGGKTWSTPERVAHGTGTFSSPGIFNDKEYVTAWGKGNAIVTWTVFNDGKGGITINNPIFAAVTHDGGNTWTTGTEISGSAPFCIGAQGGTACDQDQFSVPTVASDGSIHVAFESLANSTTGRDQYLVVKVDPTTGKRIAGPYQVAQLIDGITDYPIDAEGRQTYQDSQFRTNSAGNITADPTNAQHLAVVWSDMRNSTLPAPSDPYAAKTNSDIVVSQSTDGGLTWLTPTVLQASGDQFMPWGAYDASGKLHIGYFDRSYDPANHQFGFTLASETTAGSLNFTFTQVTTTLSDPTQGDRWFSGTTVNSSFPHPSSFIGDYSGINVGANGVVLLWTDMRNTACFTTRCGSGEDAFFASH